jgi:hypothetical protein
MDAITVVIIVVVILAAVGAVAVALGYQRRRSHQLQERFGPEYERTVEEAGDRRTAESELRGREKRHDEFDLTPLTSESAARYRDEWSNLQQRFVDEPGAAVEQADQLVVRLMRERGYPVDEYDQRVDDVSVAHPDVAQSYREAHGVAVAQAEGRADTEQLRQAVTSYRRLVEALLADRGDENQPDRSGTSEHREQP